MSTTVTLTSASVSPWIVPAGVTSLTSVVTYGAGGDGHPGTSGGSGPGGGSGATSALSSLAVTPGQSINFQVGLHADSLGVNSPDTWFVDNSGGNAGTAYAPGGTVATSTASGMGGIPFGIPGNTEFNGRTGGTRSTTLNTGGGGASSAGTASNGNTGGGAAGGGLGGAAVTGGTAGGNGATTANGTGANGGIGSGGGGGGKGGSGVGGSGGNGQITITYTAAATFNAAWAANSNQIIGA